DSVALDSEALHRALPYFADARVAIVQCRSVGVDRPGDGAMRRALAKSVDAFDVILYAAARFGWQPFIGHNAILRTAAVQEVGGLTPGYFSDDLDLTIRLNLRE